MKTCYTDEHIIGRLLGGDCCCFLENNNHEKMIDPIPLILKADEKVPVGTRFSRLGNGSTSAGNGDLTFKDGLFFEYQGTIQSLDGDLAVFYQVPGEKPANYLPCYWKFVEEKTGYGYLIYFNRCNAGRVVHLEKCEYKLPEGIEA